MRCLGRIAECDIPRQADEVLTLEFMLKKYKEKVRI